MFGLYGVKNEFGGLIQVYWGNPHYLSNKGQTFGLILIGAPTQEADPPRPDQSPV